MNNKIKLSLIATLLLSINTLNASEDLGTITVSSATKSEQSIKDVTSNIEVITSAELDEKNYTTVTQALNSISGISFTSNGGLGKLTSVRIRGLDSKRVLVLIDGIRYNDITGLSGAPFEHLMVTDIKQIEVVKGAQSGVWGSDATAGVINIITKKPENGLTGTINTEVGSFNTRKYGATAAYKEQKYYFKVSSQKIKTDGFTAYAKKSIDIDTYEDDGYKNTTTSLKFGYKIDPTNKLDILHTSIDATSQYDSSSADADKTSITKDKFSSINYQNKTNKITTDIFAKESTFNRDYPQGWTKEFDGEVNEYGLKSKIDYNEKDFLIWGIDSKISEHKNSINEKFNNKAIYFTNNNTFKGVIGGKTIFTQSLRKDNYDKFNNKLTGKLGIQHYHKNIKDFTTSLNYGTAYNVPTLYNLYNQATWTQINPEDTKSFDVSAQYKDIKITYFSNKIDDMISYKDWTTGYENISGTTTIKGYEVSYKVALNDELLIAANYTKLDSSDKDGYELERRAKEILKMNIDYYGVENLHLNLNGEYIGDRIEYTYGTHTVDATTGNYTVWNLVTNYDISKDVKVYAKVDNLTNKYYQTVNGYATSPRAYYAGMKVTF